VSDAGRANGLLSFADAGRALGVSSETVAALAEDGAVRVVDAGGRRCVPADDIERLRLALARLAPEPVDRLLTPARVAALFGVKVKTLSGWAQQGRLPYVRTLGGHRRYRESDVRRLLREDRPGDRS
jgi:excisionase family DNA binding protein